MMNQTPTFHVPLFGDKSITHRAFIFAALAKGESVIRNVGGGADLASTRGALRALGVSIERLDSFSWSVRGVGGVQGFQEPVEALDCGNSGTTIRLLAGLLSGCSFPVTLSGDPSLCRRPMSRLERALSPLGRGLETDQGGAPIIVGGERSSALTHQDQELIIIDTLAASAQLKSAALLAGLSDPRPIVVRESRLSRDHSERMLSALWGSELKDRSSESLQTSLPALKPALKPLDFTSPGDFSSAAFWIAISALSPPAAPTITLDNLNLNPTRMGLYHLASRMGIRLEAQVKECRLGEPVGTLIIYPRAIHQPLKAVTLSRQEVVDALDELPLIALLASFAEGQTTVTGARELRVKESDRIEAMTEGLSRLGVEISSTEDGWVINGDPQRSFDGSYTVESHGDHRIAMCFMIARLKQSEGLLSIVDADCLEVSYPEFPEKYIQYRGRLEEISKVSKIKA